MAMKKTEVMVIPTQYHKAVEAYVARLVKDARPIKPIKRKASKFTDADLARFCNTLTKAITLRRDAVKLVRGVAKVYVRICDEHERLEDLIDERSEPVSPADKKWARQQQKRLARALNMADDLELSDN